MNRSGMNILFRVYDDKTVGLVDFSAVSNSRPLDICPSDGHNASLPRRHPWQFLAVQVTGENYDGNFSKRSSGSTNRYWKYVSHKITDNESGSLLELDVAAPDRLHAAYFMQTYNDIPIVRTWVTLTNNSDADMGIEYVSSFVYSGIGKDSGTDTYDHIKLMLARNSWCNEVQWHTLDAIDAGLSHMPYRGYNLPDGGSNRFVYGSRDSYSTGEYMPISIAIDEKSGEIWYGQIDYSGAWTIEYGSGDDRHMYIGLFGPTDDADFWKNLKPGESFTTVPSAFGVSLGNINNAFAALTLYRRAIRRQNPDNERCYVVFNDYMNCLFGDPTEEKEKKIIDIAADLGCEYYCLDCGWYDSGPWWDKVGEWKESPERFPNGLKTVFDYCRSKGMHMGMWLEIEVMGVKCELADKLPDDWFVCTHGKRRMERGRYLLDFRNPRVRKYCGDVVDRLVNDYGCEFFKIDYNVTTGTGSDLNSDSRGEAMLEHYRAFYEWIRDIYRRHPNLVIENCGSGGQRMDYGILSLHSLQSTSDQTDYISNAYIGTSVASAVAPEQCGTWIYPYEDNREHVIFNMMNGILLRPYVSGMVWNMSESSLDILREGISTYKKIRGDIKHMLPFFPLGMCRVGDKELAYGLVNDDFAYLSVFAIDNGSVTVDLGCLEKKITDIKVIYPYTEECGYTLENNLLKVKMPVGTAARLFRLTF